MIKRYEIIKENIQLGEADLFSEIYKIMGMTKQYFHSTIKFKINNGVFKYKNTEYEIKDKLNK
jgi:hypothetical protein